MRNFLFCLISLIALASCRKESTTWYSDWVVPLVNDTLDLKELTNDSTLSIQSTYYSLDLTRTVSSIKPTDYVKIPDTTIQQTFAISVANLNIPPGTSFVNNNEDHIFDLDDIQLKKARVKTGRIHMEVFNPVATNTFFEIELSGVTSNQVMVTKSLEVPAGTQSNPSSNSLSIDLSGYYIDFTGSSGTAYNALASKLKVSSDPNGPQVSLSSQDSTKFIIKLEGIELDYGRGYFGNYKVADSYSFVSEFLKNNIQGQVDIPAVNLQVTVKNGIKTSANANLKSLVNVNSALGTSVGLNHPQLGNPFIIQTATGSWSTLTPSVKTIDFTPSNSNLEAFIENLGETTNIDYEIELNPWGNTSGGWDEFFPLSSFDVEVKAQLPLNIGLNNLEVSDSFPVSFDMDLQKTHPESGTLVLKVENAFPLQGDLKLSFLDANGQLIEEIAVSGQISSAVFGTMTAFGILSTKSELQVVIPSTVLNRINDVKFIHAKVKLNSPNISTGISEPVSIPEKAFLKLKIQAAFQIENNIN